ncbi:LysR substrate-binding domain-containing protein [Thalassotalea sp. ND16A]|uniref:LysR substrate-binding domain-containing protein n=1 Tax=Thalassotalea sp. ND16A TaxID=1535422 RepID=UPI00051A4464|nr:LysR substrate-binding domain-containing protein [Thalassotalea sp. ND16A]KGJ95728.1 hypothetical protein ND16A_1263 [Thalassotalea sp. ND16A]
MKNLPPLKSLPVFLTAAKSNSFKAAATQLFVTQAAVSQQIRLLEDHLGCQLFERQSKQTRLNNKGRLLLPFIEQAFNQISQGVKAVAFEPNRNDLRISATHSVTSLLLIPMFTDFQQQNPDLNIQFAPNNKLETFEELDIDIAIRHGLGVYPGLESRKLIEDTIVLVASPLIINSDKRDSEAIFKLPLLEDTSADVQQAITDCCLTFNVNREQLKSKLKTNDSVPIIQNALAGQGLAFISKVLVAQHLTDGNLINVLDYEYQTPLSLYLVAPAQHFTWGKIKSFETWVTSIINEDNG